MPILVVDDDPISLGAIAETLRQARYEVITAANGREAMKILASGDCPMLITDWMMPEVNGINLCREIAEGNLGVRPYIIVVSTLNDARDAELAMLSGANAFLSKPWERSELLAKVQAGELALQSASRCEEPEQLACGG